MKTLYFIIFFFVIAFISNIAFAHPGNTASDGCHYCWTNCEYYGYAYGTRHCHNSYPAPIYNPAPVYIPTPTPIPWSCTIDGEKYYNSGSAKTKWRSMVHSAVDNVYEYWLNRSANQNDYNYWETKIPYNNCNFTVSEKAMGDEVKTSDEYLAFQAKKMQTPTPRIKVTPSVLSTTAFNPFVMVKGYLSNEQWVIFFTLTAVIICLIILAVRIYKRK